MQKTISILFSFCAVLLAVLSAGAQQQPKTLARIVFVTVKNGAAQQFEDGAKKHVAWLKEHNDPFTTYVWQIVSGPRTGQYVVGTFGHDWKDFDSHEALDREAGPDVMANIAPSVASHSVSYFALMPQISRVIPASDQPPDPLSRVTTYYLKPGREGDMAAGIQQVNDAIKKSNYPAAPSEWYSLVNGGYGPQLVAVSGMKSWAGFQPPEKGMGQMLTETLGKQATDALHTKFMDSFRKTRSEILEYCPDLSYIPQSQ